VVNAALAPFFKLVSTFHKRGAFPGPLRIKAEAQKLDLLHCVPLDEVFVHIEVGRHPKLESQVLR